MYQLLKHFPNKKPWNKGRLMGQKPPLTQQEIWSIRMRLQDEGHVRDLALFNLAIDSKLRASDLLKIRVSDICSGGRVNSRAMTSQQKTGRPVRFEITARTRTSIEEWIAAPILTTILSDSGILGVLGWFRSSDLWNTFSSPNQSNVDLPPNQEHKGRAASPGTHESR